ncbi:MAG: tryptophan synthase subunit alpha [Bacteroidales bacterium]|nr:tryptophan synthase subunit alpha [Bacteroidales bacterium]
MKNRIDQLFSEKEGEILSIYMTAGYPRLQDTVRVLKALQEHGADMVEIGIPFSDPLADGPVIQQSSQIALSNGMNLELLFTQLKEIRRSVHIPLVLMGYLNPVLRMGMEEFLRRCRETGIDGVIIPDLPPAEYEARYRALFQANGIYHSLLITPHTDDQRIKKIVSLCRGFVYLVAESSTTGARNSVVDHQRAYFRRLKEMSLPVPGLIGFGISNRETFRAACSYARGAIIGSAFIRALGESNTLSLEQRVEKFIGGIRGNND